MKADTAATAAAERATWRAVALPTEHGGWSLTAEPALLGLVVAFAWPALALAVAAMLAFIARTPLRLVLVDRWRHRWLERSRLALRIAVGELVVIAALVTFAAIGAEGRFWIPLSIAAPLIGIELWYDMRSRSRRLIPELAGSVGIGSVAAAVALVGGASGLVASGLWCVVGARSLAAIPYVRHQIFRLHRRPSVAWQSDLAQLAALTIVVVGWLVDAVPFAAVVAVMVLAVFNVVAIRRRAPDRAAVIGIQQLMFGAVVMAVTAIAVLAA
jgi:hypothetical protein